MKHALILLALTVQHVSAIIIFGSGDTLSHAGPPPDKARAKLWYCVGGWGSAMGTVISSNFFATARHVGGSTGQVFTVSATGVSYTAIAQYPDPTGGDLVLWQVDKPFTYVAPLYHGGVSSGKPLFLMGRGTQRGAPTYVVCGVTNMVLPAPSSVFVDGVGKATTNGSALVPHVTAVTNLIGWAWGPGDGYLRWGTNTLYDSGDWNKLTWQFTGKGADEGTVSQGDSSGAAFVLDSDGEWKLGGIIISSSTWGGAYFTSSCSQSAFPTIGYAVSLVASSTWIWEVTGQQ